MQRIVEHLKQRNVLVSDGAWGTELQKRGLKPGECPELWCLHRRTDVLEIARAYVEAGADLIKTNSFGANRLKLAHFGLADHAADLNESAAAISREAAGDRVHVIASVGPTGRFLLMGDVTEEELYETFREQMMALERGGADGCCIETFSALDEASIAVRAAQENTRLEIIATFTFDASAQGAYRTMMGVSPTEMAKGLVEAGANIIGANCGNGMEQMIPIVAEIRAAAPAMPIIVHANAGKPVHKDGRDVYLETPDVMARHAAEVAKAGARIIGGCCGTTPDHIRALAKLFRQTQTAGGKP